MNAIIRSRRKRCDLTEGLIAQLWMDTEVRDFMHSNVRSSLPPDFYPTRVVMTLSHRVMWVLIGEGTYGRPFAGWRRPIESGEVTFFNDGLEIRYAQDLEKLAE